MEQTEQFSKKEQKQLKKQQKREERSKEQQKANILKKIKFAGVGVVVIGIIAGLIWFSSGEPNLPPTSQVGHQEISPSAHILAEPMPETIQRHMLEHADGEGAPGIIIQYNCENYSCDPDLVQKLTDIVQQYPDNVYLAPNKYDGKIILTKEGSIEVLDSFNEDAIRRFIGTSRRVDIGDSSTLRVGENGLFVADQKPGESIVVNLVFMKEDGFVVIHEVNSNGDPGAIPASSGLLSAGDSSNIVVEFPRATSDGEKFIAMLHKDNGDGEFNPNSDPPVADDQGNVVQMSFQISTNAENPGGISL